MSDTDSDFNTDLDADRRGDGGALTGEAISPDALAERLRAGEAMTILDVRDRPEFEAWHIDGPSVEAVQIPQMKFVAAGAKGGVEGLVSGLAEPLVVVCGRGEASASVAAQLWETGLDAVNLEDGMRGWARVYESRELPHPGATVVQYERPASGCLAYLVASDGEAAVIDPLRTFAERYVEDAAELGTDIESVIDTHVHADHVSGVREVAERSGAEIVLPEGAADRGLDFDARLVGDGDRLALGDVVLTARHLPGHTSEMTGYSLDDGVEADPLWVTGDTVFASAVARPDLEAGDEAAEPFARQLYETLRELLELPAATRLAPGHSQGGIGESPPTVTVGDLEDGVAVLSLDESAFVERVLSTMGAQPANYETLIAANLGQRELTDEDAFELELGPNNCAAA